MAPYLCNMFDSRRARFTVSIIAALGIVYVLGAVLTPPDPASQLLVAGLLMGVAVSLAYVLSYRGGYEALARQLNR